MKEIKPVPERKTKEVAFDWNDNLSDEAQEDFRIINDRLPYFARSSIGMALAKLEILEAQGVKVNESDNTVDQRQ